MADGRRLEIEVKTQRGRLSPEQRVFSDVIFDDPDLRGDR